MRQLILNTFPCQTGNCIEIRTETIFWIDEYPTNTSIPQELRGKSFTLTSQDDKDYLFTVNNPAKKEITFIAIDQGIFTGSFKKCDFVLLAENRICFVESKILSGISKRGVVKKEAIKQLRNTIEIFKEKIDFSNYKVEGQASVITQKIVTKRHTCSRAINVKEFEDELNVALYENNEITF